MSAAIPTSPPDRFQRLFRVGTTASGTVYKARDLQEGGMVALKVFYGPDFDAQRFEEEARVLSQLRHPGVVSYVAHGFDAEGNPYLVHEWLEGQTLAARLASRMLTLEEALRLGTRVAAALQSARAFDLVHGDLKPAKIFLDRFDVDRVKILGFGIAPTEQDQVLHSRTRSIAQSLAYASPEQAQGETVTHLSDVFSLGVVLYECLTGQLPFSGKTAMETLSKLCCEQPTPPSELRADVPPPLSSFVMRMLSKQPEQRPGYARTREALASVLLRGTTPSLVPRAAQTGSGDTGHGY